MQKFLLFCYVFLTVAQSADFTVAGRVKCKLDGPSGHTSGTVQLSDHDVDSSGFMIQVPLKDNVFGGLNFSESAIFDGSEPYLLIFHDCHKGLRAEGKRLARECQAISRSRFNPPGKPEIWLDFDLDSTTETQLRCTQSDRLLHPQATTATAVEETDKPEESVDYKSTEAKETSD
ncbi:unnamed protein product [Bursaphelenchus xylophilus]|uniref:(pine wood nematode) hypothetical protein n=1 Tax=Bursaphelenchus xylophilus TaxID=6326 RepID=A0A1I7RXI4_BURXY|nr:unnamed protein product [Bursaphelenchus xylophilus]CAG9126453.1 unnamed protein product [Bursaphelenchus xylophilus]